MNDYSLMVISETPGVPGYNYSVLYGINEEDCLELFANRHPEDVIINYEMTDWEFVQTLPSFSEDWR